MVVESPRYRTRHRQRPPSWALQLCATIGVLLLFTRGLAAAPASGDGNPVGSPSAAMAPDGPATIPGEVLATSMELPAGVESPPPPTPTETIEYYATDAVGSTRVVFAPDGTVLGRGDYLPYGETLPGANLPPEQFTGQARDTEAGLDYFGARGYQVRVGRFATIDPLMHGAVEDPQLWNRYAYARNNPLTFADPTGMQADACQPTGSTYIDEDGVKWQVDDSACVSGGGGGGGGSNNGPQGFWSWLGQQLADAFTGTAVISASDLNDLPPSYQPSKTDKVILAAATIGVAAIAPKAAGKVLGFVADEAAAAVASEAVAGDHIVLGLEAHGLESTAAQVGGRTLMNDVNWQSTLTTALGDANTRFTIALDGVSGGSVESQFMSAAQRGVTSGATPFNWEMGQVWQAGRHVDANFVQGGLTLPNPFRF